MTDGKRRDKHPEAFCLMWYASRDGAEKELIWNSRDGVTPFCIKGKSGRELQHVHWAHDQYVPRHTPKPGDRVFVDATRELVAERARTFVEERWDKGEMPMCEHPMFAPAGKDAAVEFFIKDWTKPGTPFLTTVKEDGTY